MARNKYDVDENLEVKFDFGQVKRLGKYLKPFKKKLILVVAVMLSASAASMLLPRFFMTVMDEYIPNKDMHGLLMVALATLAITIYVAVALRIKIKITTTIGQSVIHQLREDIFSHLQELPFSYYDSRPYGKIQVRVVNYVNNLSDLLSNGIINTITDLCSLVFVLIFMFSIHVKLTLVCMCGFPVLAVVVFLIKKKQRRAWQNSSNKQSNLNAYIAESINGIRVTQAFVRERENAGIFNRLSENCRKAWMGAIKFNFLIHPTVDNISTITTAFIYLLGISWMVSGAGDVTVGIMIAFTGYIGRFWAPITTLAGFYNSLLKDVVFSYEDGVMVLNGINFIAQKGQSFAIVGPTGAGKTTIVNLLSRFYNLESGQILIDGVDINTVTIRSLRTQMGVMMQESFIFSGTIMDNIRYGNMDATDEEVIAAAKTVCAHDFIKDIEDGYYTQVNERGSRLSVGQRQLISFARALLADPKILILDEATSSIDTETEIVLQKGLNRLLEGRTSFIIAHRLSTIKNSSCIMYVDRGNIQEMGSHDELMELQGEYYKLYMSQYEFLKRA